MLGDCDKSQDSSELSKYLECINEYVKHYVYSGESTLDSYIHSHKNNIKVKASMFHSRPEVLSKVLEELVNAPEDHIRSLSDKTYKRHIINRYKHYVNRYKVTPIEDYLKYAEESKWNKCDDPCEALICLNRAFGFFEVIQKEKYCNAIEKAISYQEGRLARKKNRDKSNWESKHSKAKKIIYDNKVSYMNTRNL